MADIKFEPGSGAGDKEVSVSGVCNPGIDETLQFDVRTNDGKVVHQITVNQEGKREPFYVKNGDSYEPFLLSDGGTFNVVKEKFKDNPDCALVVNTIFIDQTNSDPFTRVSGDINGNIIQNIRNNSHRVLGKFNNNVMNICQLDDNDSTKYFDGTPADLTGSQGNVFMQHPTFYTAFEDLSDIEGGEVALDKVAISFAMSPQNDGRTWMEWKDNDLIGVYPGSYDSESGKLRSVSGNQCATFNNIDDIIESVNNNGNGFSCVKQKHRNIIGVLYVAMYGNTWCQNTIGIGNAYDDSIGQTDLLGMNDTQYDTEFKTPVNIWGLEGWWSADSEFIDGVIIKTTPVGNICILNDGSNVRELKLPEVYNAFDKLVLGDHLDLIAYEGSGSFSEGSNYDYGWVGEQRFYSDFGEKSGYVFAGWGYGIENSFGILSFWAGGVSSTLNANTRITFSGEVVKHDSVLSFESIAV